VRARETVERARAELARALGARAEQVVFTSGGTEANALAVFGLTRAPRSRARGSGAAAGGAQVLFGAGEHPSVRENALALAGDGLEVAEVPLARDGGLDLAALERLLGPATLLVCVMLVNNELGIHYPVREIGHLVRARAPRARLHVDAVQAFGKVDVRCAELGCDSLAVGAHKLHGPKGIGALVLAPGVEPQPLLRGGGQERGLRSGTENVAAIAGFAAAAAAAERALAAADENAARCRAALLAATAGSGVEPLFDERGDEHCGDAPRAGVLGPGAERAAAILPLVVPAHSAESWLAQLEARGVIASAGSACHSRSHAISHVHAALGLEAELARRVMRVSFSRFTPVHSARAAGELIAELARELGARAGHAAGAGLAPRASRA
jgi:cysteine desulfurase